ncbi:MAG: hypothetical protein R3F59_06475 [Myxococcota bacterium]
MRGIWLALLVGACTPVPQTVGDDDDDDTTVATPTAPDTAATPTDTGPSTPPGTTTPGTTPPGAPWLAFEVAGITVSGQSIARFRTLRTGVPYSDWLDAGWDGDLALLPARHDGFEIEAPCDDTALWDAVAGWRDRRAGDISAVDAEDGLTGQVTFSDVVLDTLDACDGAVRRAQLAGRFDLAPAPAIGWTITGVGGPFDVERIQLDGGPWIATEADWLAMSVPRGGTLTVEGLCGTPASSAAYGWSSLNGWLGTGGAASSLTLYLAEPDGTLIGGTVDGYDATIAQITPCGADLADRQRIVLDVGSFQ